jgi:WD40 repeat protein
VLVICAGWRDDPLRALADAIEAAVRDQLGDLAPAPPPFTPRLEVLLTEWLRRLDECAAALAPGDDEPPRSELLLVLDQFEEYFLYHPDEDGEGTLAFELPRAVMRDDLRVAFLVSIREDAYTQLDRFEGRVRNLFGSNFRLEHLDEPAARRAIEGPVERYNELLGDGDDRYAVEPALVDAVLGQVRAGAIALGQTGAGTVETNGGGDLRVATPFLQLVMTRLWEEELRAGSQTLRASTLEQLGGAERLVRSHLDNALAELDERARDLTAAVFHQLVTPSGTKIVHTVPDLADYARAPEPELLPVLEALAAARILRPVDPAPGDTSPRFEIFHDVLSPAILDWRAAHEQARAAREEAARQRRVRRRYASTAAGLLLLVVVFAGLAVWAVGQKRTAEEAADRAGSGVVAARAREVSYGPGVSALAGAEAYRLSPSLEARSLLLSSLHMNAAMPQILVGHSQSVGSLAFSPDGSLASGSSDWTVRLWDKDGRPVGNPYTAPSEAEVASVAFNEDGTLLAAAIEYDIHVFEVAPGSWTHLGSFYHNADPDNFDPVTAVAFVAGDLLASGGADGHLRIWDVSDLEDPDPVDDEPLGGDVANLAYSSTGRLLAAAGPAPSLWRVAASGELEPGPELAQANEPANAVAFSPDGKTLAAAIGSEIFLWKTGASKPRKLVGLADVLSVAFAGNTTLISGGFDDSVTVWDLAPHGGVFGPPRTHAGDVQSIAVGPHGTIASGGDDTYIKLWSLEGREALAATISDSLSVELTDLAVDAGGLVAIANGKAGTSLWRLRQPSSTVRSREPVATIVADMSYAVAFSGTILAASDGASFALWETGPDCSAAPREPCLLDGESVEKPVKALAFSPKGELLAVADEGGGVTLWETSDPQRIRRLTSAQPVEEETWGTSVAFSPDGALLVASYYNGTVRLWDIRDPQHPRARASFKAQDGQYVESVTFSPRGRLLAVGGGAETAEFFDVRDPKRATRIEPPLDHDNGVWELAFSPNGRVLATGTATGDVRFWDVEARRPLGVSLPGSLPGREADVNIEGLAFAADGRLVSGGKGNPVVAWDPALWSDDAEVLRATACNLARQNLEAEQWEFFFQDTSIEDSRRKTCPEYPLPRG